MSLQQIDFSKTLTDDQVYEGIMNNYTELGKDWISHQWNWMNGVYWAFNDHYKYMIVISLVEKTLQFYDQMNIQYSYEEYYSKSYLQIEKFSITELCEKLKLPKEGSNDSSLKIQSSEDINLDESSTRDTSLIIEKVKETNTVTSQRDLSSEMRDKEDSHKVSPIEKKGVQVSPRKQDASDSTPVINDNTCTPVENEKDKNIQKDSKKIESTPRLPKNSRTPRITKSDFSTPRVPKNNQSTPRHKEEQEHHVFQMNLKLHVFKRMNQTHLECRAHHVF